MSSIFQYQPFFTVSGDHGGKVPVAGDVLSSHEQEIYPSTSPDENCIEFDFHRRTWFWNCNLSGVAVTKPTIAKK